ncbi:YodC family protein [Prosthecomicrobium sp. N25]|uniref:YodC family protein n=1 Tax=Prosthecomicrobium sp. N25 TaxID=3129254 RepID=UPI0030784F01
MAAASIEPGDVVMLKSGGPAMTVIEVADNIVTCLWYADGEEVLRTSSVPVIALTAVEHDDAVEDEDEDIEEEEDD